MSESRLSSRFVFAAACLGMLLFGISLTTLGSVATGLQAKFDLDPVSSGALFSMLPFGIVAGSLVFGPIVDRYGYKTLLCVSCFAMFAGFEGIAFAVSPIVLKVCVFWFGFGGGAINGATNAVVADISPSNKGANLSLLGIFFAIGALGMPFLLGSLQKLYDFSQIVSAVGSLALIAGGLFLFTSFPVPKQSEGIRLSTVKGLLSDRFLLTIALFLFCQSSFEGVINNWTTTFLSNRSIAITEALYALSLYVTGMAFTRLILGSLLRRTPPQIILITSLTLLLAGCLVLRQAESYAGSVAGLMLIGAGLAPGFPVMLGFVGDRYAALSGTAFSIVISIALAGNMVVSYITGIFVDRAGIASLMAIPITIGIFMLILALLVLKKQKT